MRANQAVRFIEDNFPVGQFDPMDPLGQATKQDQGLFVFLGVKSFGGAVSLSQWGYDVSVMVRDLPTAEVLKEAADKHAGLFKNIFVRDYIKEPCPPAHFAVFIEMEEVVYKRHSNINNFIRLTLSSAQGLLCTVTQDVYEKIDKKRFNVHIIAESYANHTLLCIEKH